MMGMIDVYPTIKRLVGVTSKDRNRLDGMHDPIGRESLLTADCDSARILPNQTAFT